ncbi:MAG TPA: 3-hydroxyacyl-CoA dehydrogenase [Rhodopila sp.]|jgi:3-hydroxyacyl-CoA dehydrogenase|nr:3-hydroxyacyl-CoA dehydrogenase [Rhodopila sp.]
MKKKIAVVGTGLVGGAWAITFARGGRDVALWDAKAGAAAEALRLIAPLLDELEIQGLLLDQKPATVLSRIRPVASLAEALADAAYVQENVTENVEVKQALFRELDRIAAPATILASSSTAIRPSRFTEALAGRGRCLVAHPINPPYVIPAVEIVPAPWTATDAVEATRALMQEVGQIPLVMRQEAEGFIMNRLQAALLQEAFRMVAAGIASVEDIDAGIKKGIGLRWAFIGPFETINLNAPGGVADYAARYGEAMYEIAQTQTQPMRWEGDLLAQVASALDERTPPEARANRQVWRDKRLMALMAHMAEMEKALGS